MNEFSKWCKKYSPCLNPTRNQSHDFNSYVYEASEMPTTVDPKFWWTLLGVGKNLVVTKGLVFANRLGYINCQNPWIDTDPTEFTVG